jgi:hypothetical protein
VFGIAEDTALLLDEGEGRVVGRTRSCIRGSGKERWLEPGERFELGS